MKLEELKTDISKMSDNELREFILENRKAQSRYREAQANAPKRVRVSSMTEEKKKEDKIKALIQSIDPEVLKKILVEKGVT